MKEGWEYKKLGEFIEEYSVRDKGKNFPVFSVTNSQGFCQEYFDKNVASKDTTNYKVVPFGYFAYNPSRINVGSVALQNQMDNVSVSPLYIVFKVSDKIRQEFLLYYLKSNYCMTFIKAYSRGAVRNNLHLSTLKTFNIPCYSIDTQQRIVEELDLLSSIIEKKKAQLKELDSLAQSIFYDMFGDNNYEIVTLGEVVEIKSTLVSPTDLPYSEMLHVSPSNIISNVGSIVDCVKAKEESLISGKYTFSKGMILYSKIRPNLNKVAIPNFDGICSADMYPLSIKGKVNSIFIWRLLLSKGFLEYAIKHSGRARMPKLNREALFAYRFPLPPLPLQQQFAEKVETIEHQKEMIKQSIKEVETLFNSRMDYYFN